MTGVMTGVMTENINKYFLLGLTTVIVVGGISCVDSTEPFMAYALHLLG